MTRIDHEAGLGNDFIKFFFFFEKSLTKLKYFKVLGLYVLVSILNYNIVKDIFCN